MTAWTLHNADRIAGSAGRGRVVRIEEGAGGAVPARAIGLAIAIGLDVAIGLNVGVTAAVLVLHGIAASSRDSAGRRGLGHGPGLGRALGVVVAAVHDLEAAGQRALAAGAAEAVRVVRLAVHVQPLAVPSSSRVSVSLRRRERVTTAGDAHLISPLHVGHCSTRMVLHAPQLAAASLAFGAAHCAQLQPIACSSSAHACGSAGEFRSEARESVRV
ncbi:unnamed protein product [Phytophthora fragariaefolia]|uniref:Unnamed protein product n=1 Tax=Phytophthora fragariaefolia TaxID=1490495 RepID=A0A9W6TWT4_9STRA|nr:unnamed protein product [Phytophthora fragariaefolia]